MAVKEKSDSQNSEVDVEWNSENELQLFQIVCGNKPVGINKYFQMACIVEKLSSNLNKEVTAKVVWEHLSTMYDLNRLDEIEGVPFPLEEQEFCLPQNEYGELMAGKLETESKKSTKKDDLRKDRAVEQNQSADKKGTKRTRANTAPVTVTPSVTPKRRRI